MSASLTRERGAEMRGWLNARLGRPAQAPDDVVRRIRQVQARWTGFLD